MAAIRRWVEVRPSARRRRPLSAIALLVIVLVLVAVALAVAWRAAAVDLAPGGLVLLALDWSAVAWCWTVVTGGQRRRRSATSLLVALAVSSWVLGFTLFLALSALAGEPPLPSLADVFGLAFYPLAFAALAVDVRHRLRGASAGTGLDMLIVAAGVAAVMAVVLQPVVQAALSGEFGWAATAVSVAYPLGDLVLISAIAPTLTLPRGPANRSSAWIVGGLVLLAVADLSYSLRVALGVYQAGTALDGVWTAGLVLIGVGVYGLARTDAVTTAQDATVQDATVQDATAQDSPVDGDPAASRLAVTIPLLAMLGAVAVLVGGSRIRLSDVAVALAATTVLTAAVRMHHAFRNIMKVADLRRQAGTDDLTGLPNRRAFCERAAIELEALANEGSHAVLLLDLDRFKQVNDSLGHHAGDELLVLLARRLAAAIRACDTLARLGGDEFAVLLPGTSAEEAARQASHLRAVVVAPFEIGGQRVRCDVSIGIALAPAHGRDLSGLLRCADVAMYRAKQAKQGWLVYRDCEGNPNVEAHRDEVTEKDVRLALQRRELVLHYQPMIRLNTWAVCGVEALVRWRHPRKGLIRPADFLPIVEEAGLSLELTAAVLGAALDDAAQWWSRGQLLSVAINVSADLLVQDELTESLMPHLVARGLPPAALTIEISEGCISADPDWVSTVLRRLRESGMRIALDDFGTGHSSLARLRDLPVDAVKLDKSFLPAIGADPRAAGLVASVAHLAHGLDLELVAEGVGDAPTLLALTRLGCDQAQGHYLGRPMPAGDLLAWLELHRTGDTATEPSAGTTARASVRAATEATGLP